MHRCLQGPEDAEMAAPAASKSLAAQRVLAQSIRQEMGILDEENEALAVGAPPLFLMPHNLALCIMSPNLAFGRVLDRDLWRITHACTLTWEECCSRDR